jgi:hypothetical protein
MLLNAIRGLVGEFGIIAAQGAGQGHASDRRAARG